MRTETCQFKERTFEILFDAEFLRNNAGSILSLPDIPDHNLEAEMGYDIQFRLKRGQQYYSVCLQHKVPRRCATRKPGCDDAKDQRHSTPYYVFTVYKHKERLYRQHNALVAKIRPNVDVFYSVPLFHTTDELRTYFRAGTVIANTLWIDPSEIGLITDKHAHKISYDRSPSAFYWSKPADIRNVFLAGNFRERLQPRLVNEEYLDDLRRTLEDAIVSAYDVPLDISPEVPQVVVVDLLLRKHFGLRWLLVPVSPDGLN